MEAASQNESVATATTLVPTPTAPAPTAPAQAQPKDEDPYARFSFYGPPPVQQPQQFQEYKLFGETHPFGADFEAALAAIRLPSGTAFDDGGLLGLFRHPDASLKK